MSGSALMDALSDPGVDALMGAAQGFAQAAMPSRMPIPFGAAIGMGAGGALQGARESQQLRQGALQNQAAQMQNQMTKMYLGALPGAIPGMAPFGAPPASGDSNAPPPASGTGTGAPVASSPLPGGGAQPSGSGGSGDPYLVSPQRLVALGQLALMRGDPATAKGFYEQAETMAGGPGYAMGQNGTAFAVPGGGKSLGVIAANAAAEKGGALPATLAAQGFQMGPNGTFQPIPGGQADPNYQGALKAQNPVDLRVGGLHWDAVHGWVKNPERVTIQNPDGSKGFAFVSPPAPGEGGNPTPGSVSSNAPPPDPFPGWAKQINAGENSTGNPGATNPASSATGNGQFINGTWPAVIRAARPDLAAGQNDQQLLALRSNPDLAQAATETYARQNAGTLAQAGLPVTGETVNLAHVLGPNGAISVLRANPSTPLAMLLPQQVIQANPQFQGKTAGDAVAWSSARMGTPLPEQPQQAGGGTAVPVMGLDGKPLVESLSPQQNEGREAAAREFLTKDNDAYQAAQNTQAWLRQIDNAADTMTKAGPLYMTGPYAEQRLGAMSSVNDMARSLGLTPPFDQNAVASWEEMKKATTTAGFELSSHYEGHARQAAATIMNATSAVPAQTNSPVGQKLVSAGIREGAQSAIDLHNYKQQIYNQTGGAGLESAENDYYQAHPAEQYAQRAISTVHPVHITDPSQFNNYLPGTYALLPNGKLVQVPEREGAPPIPSYLRQQPQPPQQQAAVVPQQQ